MKGCNSNVPYHPTQVYLAVITNTITLSPVEPEPYKALGGGPGLQSQSAQALQAQAQARAFEQGCSGLHQINLGSKF
jgi:hypothetical protein